jgi:hypothetical protein
MVPYLNLKEEETVDPCFAWVIYAYFCLMHFKSGCLSFSRNNTEICVKLSILNNLLLA